MVDKETHYDIESWYDNMTGTSIKHVFISTLHQL